MDFFEVIEKDSVLWALVQKIKTEEFKRTVRKHSPEFRAVQLFWTGPKGSQFRKRLREVCKYGRKDAGHIKDVILDLICQRDGIHKKNWHKSCRNA